MRDGSLVARHLLPKQVHVGLIPIRRSKENEMTVKGTKWFTEMGNPAVIGIVLVEFDKMEQQRFAAPPVAAYIGTGVPGETGENDEDKIVHGGARFPVSAAEVLMGC